MTSTATRRELMRMIGVEYGRELARMAYPYVLAAAVFALAQWDARSRQP